MNIIVIIIIVNLIGTIISAFIKKYDYNYKFLVVVLWTFFAIIEYVTYLMIV